MEFNFDDVFAKYFQEATKRASEKVYGNDVMELGSATALAITEIFFAYKEILKEYHLKLMEYITSLDDKTKKISEAVFDERMSNFAKGFNEAALEYVKLNNATDKLDEP